MFYSKQIYIELWYNKIHDSFINAKTYYVNTCFDNRTVDGVVITWLVN